MRPTRHLPVSRRYRDHQCAGADTRNPRAVLEQTPHRGSTSNASSTSRRCLRQRPCHPRFGAIRGRLRRHPRRGARLHRRLVRSGRCSHGARAPSRARQAQRLLRHHRPEPADPDERTHAHSGHPQWRRIPDPCPAAQRFCAHPRHLPRRRQRSHPRGNVDRLPASGQIQRTVADHKRSLGERSAVALLSMWARYAKVSAALIGITTALALISIAQTAAWAAYEGRDLPWGVVVVARLFDWYTCLIFLPFLYWLVQRLQARHTSWTRTSIVLLLASIAVSVAKYAIFLPLQQWISGNRTTTLAGVLSGNVLIELMIFWAAIAIMYGFEYYHHFRERERVQLVLERRISEMQLEALRAQLHPHFLFNTLNAIATVLHRDPARADKAIVNLAELLRAVMEQREREEISLVAEIALAKRYLDIMSLRSGENIKVTWSVPAEAQNVAVPYFILQPLLENALEHGFADGRESGRLDIAATLVGESLHLSLEDNGSGPGDAAASNGIGLSATSRRLTELYGDRGRLRLNSAPGGGSRVVIELPLKYESAAA